MPGGGEETEPRPGVPRLLRVLRLAGNGDGGDLSVRANTPAGTTFSEENTNQESLQYREENQQK